MAKRLSRNTASVLRAATYFLKLVAGGSGGTQAREPTARKPTPPTCPARVRWAGARCRLAPASLALAARPRAIAKSKERRAPALLSDLFQKSGHVGSEG
eukprot:4751497-Alexandrium_andersonii.AAC.1